MNTLSFQDTPLREGKEHPNSPSKKGWQAKPDGVADTPLKEGNEHPVLSGHPSIRGE